MAVIIGWAMIALSILGLFDPQNWTSGGLSGGFSLFFFGMLLAGGAWDLLGWRKKGLRWFKSRD